MGAATTSVRLATLDAKERPVAGPHISRPTFLATGRHTNIVWSNGALDPWSGQGVYPPGGGPGGPMVQNVSADGSQISLMLDLGAHHLDLMFSHPDDPKSVIEARKVELEHMHKWVDEADPR